MNLVLTLILSALVAELAVRLPFSRLLKVLRLSGRRAVFALTAKRVSDHWKEKVMSVYTRRTINATVMLAVLVVVLFGAATILVLGMSQLSDGFQAFILSWAGLGGSIAAASIYAVARKAIIRD